MFNLCKVGDGKYAVEYLNSRRIIYVYKCRKRWRALEEEVKYFENFVENTFAVIPINAVSTPLSLMIGVLLYNANASLTSRFRNKGLVLSMFITGRKQLYETIRLLKEKYVESDSYYLVVIDGYRDGEDRLKECEPLSIEQSVKDVNTDVLKNIYNLINVL